MASVAPPRSAGAGLGAPDASGVVLDVDDLSVRFQAEDGVVSALDRVSVRLHARETLGILGESGSGKTTLALAVMTLLPENARVEGTAKFGGELIAGPEISGAALRSMRRGARRRLHEKLAQFRWKGVSMVFQGSMNAFNPVYPIGKQIGEAFRLHTDLPDPVIRAKVVEAVQRAGLDPRVVRSYPHELSGGMKQRAVIAMALCLEPRLVIADEPTTGLDVVTQARLIDELKRLRAGAIGSLIVISHDIGVIAQLADHVMVLYAGRQMEYGSASDIFLHPANPYTRALVESYPSLARARAPIAGIPGAPPDPVHRPPGCAFAPRCDYVQAICRAEEPPLIEVAPGHKSACHFARQVLEGTVAKAPRSEEPLPTMDRSESLAAAAPILEGEQLTKLFDLRATSAGALLNLAAAKRVVRAVDHVDFEVRPSEILAVVGESGSGKTTLGKTILKLLDATSGRLEFHLPDAAARGPARKGPSHRGGGAAGPDPTATIDVVRLKGRDPRYRTFRRATQMIFQDPYDSLDPNMSIYDIIEEPLTAHRETADPSATLERIKAVLRTARLTPPENYLDRYPHELSGGERQRVAAARALVMDPPFLVADEPISMLDVSLRAGFLNLLKRLRSERGTTIVYITHDIASARYVADRILVLYLGVGVELGPSESVIRTPLHPYTKALIQAVPLPTPAWNPGALEIHGEIGNAIDVPVGCRFSRRCPYRQPKCDVEPPPRQGGFDHWYLCHFTQDELRQLRPGPVPPAPASG